MDREPKEIAQTQLAQPYDQPLPKIAVMLPFTCGTIWLALVLLWIMMFIQQERGKQAIDALITARGRSTVGTLTSAWQHTARGGRVSYDLTYSYTLPSGEQRHEMKQITDEEFARLAIPYSGSSLQPIKHPTPITIEYDPVDPAHHRIRGLRYGSVRQGDLAPGIAIGAVIGMGGFLFFTSTLWARWYRQRKGITTYADATQLKARSDRFMAIVVVGIVTFGLFSVAAYNLSLGPKYRTGGIVLLLFGIFFLFGLYRAFRENQVK